jgi:glucose-1-phosphate thymidylyltransferase
MINTIIPVAGRGARLGLSSNEAKCMVDINGHPCIDHILHRLAGESFVKNVTLVVNADTKDVILNHVSKWNRRFNISHVIQEKPEGLGHAIWLVLESQKKNREYMFEDSLCVINGDTITPVRHDKLFSIKSYWITVTPRGESCNGDGTVLKSGYVRSVLDKESELTVAGIYHFKKAMPLYEALSTMIDNNFRINGEFQLSDAIEGMLGSGYLFRYHFINKVYDVGTPERLEIARQNCFINQKEN